MDLQTAYYSGYAVGLYSNNLAELKIIKLNEKLTLGEEFFRSSTDLFYKGVKIITIS